MLSGRLYELPPFFRKPEIDEAINDLEYGAPSLT